MSKRKCWYTIQGFDIDTPNMKKKMTEKEMIRYAKKQLKSEHSQGQERRTKISDLSEPINAWVYLKDNGLGIKTNCKKW
jgi:hypothetical protein